MRTGVGAARVGSTAKLGVAAVGKRECEDSDETSDESGSAQNRSLCRWTLVHPCPRDALLCGWFCAVNALAFKSCAKRRPCWTRRCSGG